MTSSKRAVLPPPPSPWVESPSALLPQPRPSRGGGERWAPLVDLAASNPHHALEAVISVTFLRRLSHPLLSSFLLPPAISGRYDR